MLKKPLHTMARTRSHIPHTSTLHPQRRSVAHCTNRGTLEDGQGWFSVPKKGPSGPECSSAQDLDLLLLSSLRTLVVWDFWNPHAFLLWGYEMFFFVV